MSVQDGEVLITGWGPGRDGWVLLMSAGDRPVLEQVFDDGEGMVRWLVARMDRCEADGKGHLVAHIGTVLDGIYEVFRGAEWEVEHGFGAGWGSDQ